MSSDIVDSGMRTEKKPIVGRVVLRDQIRIYLADAILNGEYNAGDRIVETRLAQQLGVSQGAVREALRELEWMGFLETQPFSGTYIKRMSVQDLIDLYPVRAALEALGSRLAVERITDSDLQELRDLVDDMVAVSEAGDARGMVERNYAFHARIINACGNAMLIRIWSMFQFSYWTTLSTTSLIQELVYLAKRHYMVVDALVSRDPERAAAAMHDHIMELIDLLNAHSSKPA